MSLSWRSHDHPLFAGKENADVPASALSDQDVEHGHSLFEALFASVPSGETEDPGAARARASSTAVLGVPLFSCFEMLIKYLSTAPGQPYILFLTACSRQDLHNELRQHPPKWRQLAEQAGGAAALTAKLHRIDIR